MEDPSIQNAKKLGLQPEVPGAIPTDRTLWTIEVWALVNDQPKCWRYHNYDDKQLMTFRQNFVRGGLMVPVASDHFIIMHPLDIDRIEVWRQKKYFEQPR